MKIDVDKKAKQSLQIDNQSNTERERTTPPLEEKNVERDRDDEKVQ